MRLSRKQVVIGAVSGVLLAGVVWLALTLLLPKTSVSAAFDNPPEWPGYTWSRHGHPASHDEITSAAGPRHCQWQTATFLNLGWPLGSQTASARDAKLFIRDPYGAVTRTYQKGWQKQARLPSDAYATGYRLDAIELYLSDSDPAGAYLVAPAGTERWPLASDFRGCA
jgi:hypothetical protein